MLVDENLEFSIFQTASKTTLPTTEGQEEPLESIVESLQ